MPTRRRRDSGRRATSPPERLSTELSSLSRFHGIFRNLLLRNLRLLDMMPARSALRNRPNFLGGPVRARIDDTFLILKSTDRAIASSLRRTPSLASVLALLVAVAIAGSTTVHAQSQTPWTSSGWVSSGTIFDLTGNSNLAQS